MSISIEVLTAVILSFILREAPNVKKNPELTEDFRQDIAATVSMHMDVASEAPTSLVHTLTDVLILSAVTYRETRFRLPAVDGDCRMTHRLLGVPSGSWPKDYVPVMKRVCVAVGPQQLNKGGVKHLPPWPEIQELFPERSWTTAEGRKKDKLTEAQLRDPLTNIKLSYGILVHWKNECRHKDGSVAPVGVWYTAYRYGRCPFLAKTGRYYIDHEAETRCALVTAMASGLEGSFTLPQDFKCVYASKKSKKSSDTVEASWSQ